MPTKRAPKPKYSVFVSHNRPDKSIVAPVVMLVRLSGDDEVFFDLDSIEAGEQWAPTFVRVIDAADTSCAS